MTCSLAGEQILSRRKKKVTVSYFFIIIWSPFFGKEEKRCTFMSISM